VYRPGRGGVKSRRAFATDTNPAPPTRPSPRLPGSLTAP